MIAMPTLMPLEMDQSLSGIPLNINRRLALIVTSQATVSQQITNGENLGTIVDEEPERHRRN